MPTDRDSESIFTSVKKHDVRHDIETVHEKWSVESGRRRKRAMAILIPGAILAIGLYVLLAYTCDFVPGYYSFHPYQPPEPPKEEATAETTPELGNPKARMHIRIASSHVDPELRETLLEATESKPSEIHVKLLRDEDLAPEQLDAIKAGKTSAVTINGKSELSFTRYGKQGTLNLAMPMGMGYSKENLMIAIMALHAKLYGTPKVPVYVPKDDDGKPITMEEFTALEKRKQAEIEKMERERVKAQDFDFLPNVLPAPQQKR